MVCLLSISRARAIAQSLTPLCQPQLSDLQTVVTAAQRQTAGAAAIPPITDQANGFAWPDTGLGALPTSSGLVFFASDGAHHNQNNKYGSVTRTSGTLNDPLGTAPPIDVIVHPNPDASVNPNYAAYTYLGGVKAYEVPAGSPGAGNLLGVYHAEINTRKSFYSLLGMAASLDGGLHWTDLGEIVRLNQPYNYFQAGFDIGAPSFVVSPDGQYFYIYFPDWIDTDQLKPVETTHLSVARAAIASVFAAAFSPDPHAAPFVKYYQGAWDQPGIGGLSTDLNPDAQYSGSPNAAFNSALARYVMLNDDTMHIAYSESIDGLTWTLPALVLTDPGPSSVDYAVPLGTGSDPNVLGQQFYVFFTLSTPGGWPDNAVERFTLTCQ